MYCTVKFNENVMKEIAKKMLLKKVRYYFIEKDISQSKRRKIIMTSY
jgi:hypothetical protein